jgi:glycosyltransferase involved in cell wall biosynthesis
VFCLPSVERTEAFGLVLLEAMSQGLPLVTTRVPGSGMNAVNEHGVTGLSVPPADPKSLGHALRAITGGNEEHQKMAEACRKRFSERFDIGPVAQKIEKLYASIS